MKQKKLKIGCMLAVLILLIVAPLHSQQRISISAGVGFPEIYHIGLRYHWDQKQIGFYYGFAEDAQSIGISLGFHLFGNSQKTPIKPIYLKIGAHSTRYEDFLFFDQFKFKMLDIRGGYVLNFSSRVGIELDAGPAVMVGLETDNFKSAGGIGIGIGFGGRFFVRL